ncbi:MAG: hypothetical protein CNC91_00255 [Flavobacteriales bacterium MED-G22]|nr:MAG: hypothetical protein CNC91_00255 [Flavobacteriales bacterium MED-G22]|tara:strand:- start:794 stop:2626 length:1833 start_codon:yes stop_codon:yes gene_type:complete
MVRTASVTSLAILFLVTLLHSCEKDFHQVSGRLFESEMLQSQSLIVPVNTFQEGVSAVESSGLPLAQLGQINHPVFGNSQAKIVSQLSISTDPFFGNFRQLIEENPNEDNASQIPENEKVKAVYLEIPFFTNQLDSDNDGVVDAFDVDPNDPNSNSDSDNLTDLEESRANLNPLNPDSDGDGILDHEDDDNAGYDSEDSVYEIDSLYGNPEARFNLKVTNLTYYLNTLDPTLNFEKDQLYYSNQDFYEDGFYDQVLFDDQIELNFDELRFLYKEDDPETEDVDETTQIETRLSPRLRVPLEASFFQEHVLDKEGDPVLANNSNFNEYVRGIIIQTDQFTEDLYMLLDISNGAIKMEYTFDEYDTNGTVDNADDDSIITSEKTFEIALDGIQVNTLKNSRFDATIAQRIALSESGQQADKLFIKSGQWHGRVRLFGAESGGINTILLDSLRNQNQLINEAKLSFYVDANYNTNADLVPPRLYLYDLQNGNSLLDQNTDNSESLTGTNLSKSRYGGILELNESNKPYRYVFKITEHISNIIRSDSTNIDLGIVVSADINDVSFRATKNENQTKIKYPTSSLLNPLGVVLIGSKPEANQEDKKVQLELLFTKF